MKSILIWCGVGVLVAGGAFLMFQFAPPQDPNRVSESEKPTGPDHSTVMSDEGATHVPEGTRVTYRSNPPTSGSHWQDPLLDGIYEKEKPEEAIVHSLEHGRIWVSYKPDLNQGVIQMLKDAVQGQSAIVMTPRSANETDIALAAWMRLDTFNLNEGGTFDTNRILDFIKRYRNKGPEYVPQMTGKRYE